MSVIVYPKAKVRGPRQNLRKQDDEARRSPVTSSTLGNKPKSRIRSLGFLSDSFRTLKGIKMPSEAPSSIIVNRRILYRWDTGNTSQTFSIEKGHQQFLVSSDTGVGSVLYPIVDAWRIKKIRFFLLNDDSGEAMRMSLTPVGTDSDNNLEDLNRTYSMVSESDSIPNVFVWTPSSLHPSGMWHRANTTNPTGGLFLIEASTNADRNCYVEISFQCVINYAGSAPGYSVSVAGSPTIGAIYAAVWGTAGTITPLGINSITI